MIGLLAASLIAGGATLLSGIIKGISSSAAATTQANAAQAGIDEQKAQLAAYQESLKPYTTAGAAAVKAQGDLAGTNGPDAQKAATDAIANSPQMTALTQQGENSITQNAAATGGLRGGNIQGALAQFRPQLLTDLINQQYTRLGGLSTLGQNAAVNGGTAGIQTGANVATSLNTQGAAVAGGQLAAGQAWNAIPNAFTSTLGTYAGLGGKF